MEVTVTFKLRKTGGTWVRRELLLDELLPKLEVGQLVPEGGTYTVAGIEVVPSRADEDEFARQLGPILLLLEKRYLAGEFDDDPATMTLVERLLTRGAVVMEIEEKRRVQTAPRRERRETLPPPTGGDPDDEYGQYLMDWLERRAA